MAVTKKRKADKVVVAAYKEGAVMAARDLVMVDKVLAGVEHVSPRKASLGMVAGGLGSRRSSENGCLGEKVLDVVSIDLLRRHGTKITCRVDL